MSLADAYGMKQRRERMAEGGAPCAAHGMRVCRMCHGGKMMAEGGFIEEEKSSGYEREPHEHEMRDEMAEKEDHMDLNQHGEHEIGPEGMGYDNEHHHERDINHPVENQEHVDENLIGRIMKHREDSYAHGGRVKHMSEGGRIANEDEPEADFEPAEFDDLEKDDHLGNEGDYTGKNSGDYDGDAQEDKDREDIVSRIMRQRSMKQRNPYPA